MGNCCSCCCCKTKHQYLVHERVQSKPEVPRPVPTMRIPEKVEEPIPIKNREYLPPFADQNEDFLTSHLKYELSLTKLTDMRKIRRRQIFEHLTLQSFWMSQSGLKDLEIKNVANTDSLTSAWIQRTFLDIWNKAHDDIFVKEEDVKLVRRKVAEQFMFELFEIKEYVDSGLSSFSFMQSQRRANMIDASSDEALYYLFRCLKTRYPQTAIKGSLQVPDIKNTKTDVNLLDHFPSKGFSDPENLNCQTIYDDVLFLLNKAIEEQDNFKHDMKDLLGSDILSGPKVAQVTKDGKTYFNACAIRRMFMKWVENLLENCSDIKKTKIFQISKWEITNRFFFKDGTRPGTSEIAIDYLSKLIELAKYDLRTGNRRKEFTFNIYDLLRCKVKRKTTQQVIALFKKLEKTSQVKSGKRFQVIRTKNRLQTNNMDVLVNFRYGDVLVAEAQIGVDAFEETSSNKKAKLNNAVNSYIEKLERSIFGPTVELMMQYEENERPDLTLNFQAEGQIQKRTNQLIDTAKSTNRKCFNGHQMVSFEGNHWYKYQKNVLEKGQNLSMDCAFCNATYSLSTQFDFCYQCANFFCKDCAKDYQKIDLRNALATIEKEDVLTEINSFRELTDICSKYKSFIVLFWLQGSSASTMFKDTMILNQNKLRFQLNQFIPKIGYVKYSNKPEIQNIISKLGIKEYPTLILFDEKAIPFKTVLGFSWFQAPVLYALQKHILSSKKYQQLVEYCTMCSLSNKKSRMFADEKKRVNFCTGCFNTATDQYLPKQVVGYGSYCSEGHYRCMNCSYALLKIPSVYKDFLGNSYLSTTFVNPNLKKCPNGHQTQLFKGNPLKSLEYTCWNCRQKYFYDNEHGVGVCTNGQSSLCPRCMGAKIPTFRELSQNLNFAHHFSESTQQSIKCFCGLKMKKVYENRSLIPSQINNIETKNWKCSMCQREKNGTELHLACFACTFLSKNTEKNTNFNLCMKCAQVSKTIVQQKKQQQMKDVFKCPTDSSPLIYTSRIKQGKTFTCKNCKNLYFDSIARYICPSCKENYCEDCKNGLQYLHPTICKQTCEKGHSLRKRMINVEKMDIDQLILDHNLRRGPRLCSRCLGPVGFSDYNCEQDQFQLCQTCVRSQSAVIVENIVSRALRLGKEEKEDKYSSYDSNLAEVHDNYAKERSKVEIQWDDDYDEYNQNDR